MVVSVAHAGRSTTGHGALHYPALAVLGLVAAGGAFETVAETTTSNPHPVAARISSMATVLRELRRRRRPDRGSSTGSARQPRAGPGCSGPSHRRRTSASSIAPARMERRGARPPGRPPARHRSVRPAHGCTHRRAVRAGRAPPPAAPTRSTGARIAGGRRRRPHGLGHPRSVRSSDYPARPSGASWRCSRHSHARASPGRHSGGVRAPRPDGDQLQTFAASPRELRAKGNEFLKLPTMFEQAKPTKEPR